MTTNTATTTDTVATAATTEEKSATLTTAQIAACLAAFKTMHTLVWDKGSENAENLPTQFDTLSVKQLEVVAVRALRAIGAREQAAKAAHLARVKSGVESVINDYMGKARAAKAAVDALPENVRAMLPAFPTSVAIPVEELQGVLQTSNVAKIAATLKDLGLASIDGRTYAKNANVKAIHVPFVAA